MGDLTTNQIYSMLSKYFSSYSEHIQFLGVFPSDYFPLTSFISNTLTHSICCIVNTDPSTRPGKHWVAFYREHACKKIEFFDSFAQPPEKYNFRIPSAIPLVLSQDPLQALETNVCGQYCILFLMLRAQASYFGSRISPFSYVIKCLKKLSLHSCINRDININLILRPYLPNPTSVNVTPPVFFNALYE